MESEKTQLDLLKERIEYEPMIFGEGVIYYGYSNELLADVYTLSNEPQVNDIAYNLINEEMVAFGKITSVNLSLGTIVVDDKTYEYYGEITIYETYIKVLKRLLEDSKYVALSLRYPYQDYSNIELDKKYENWQLRCSVEIYQSIGTEGIKSYSENGLNWTRDSGYVSYDLRGEIEPLAGWIKDE
jgi:hypothetical protein